MQLQSREFQTSEEYITIIILYVQDIQISSLYIHNIYIRE
jgi:hypothetical protein